jgi:hypothetical protein
MPKAYVKRLLMGSLVIVAWLGFVVQGSHALLTSAATLSANTISTGSIGLLVSNSQSASSTTYAESRPGFAFTLAPGQSQESFFLLKNTSQMSSPLDLTALANVQADNPALAAAITIEIVSVDGTGVVNGQPTSVTLAELNGKYKNLSFSLPSGTAQRFKLKASLDGSYNQSNQTIGYDLVFIGTQRV